jgi:Tfp pilus assembly protein PilN
MSKKTINLLPKSEQKEIHMELIAHQLTYFWLWIVMSLAVFFVLSVLSEIQLKSSVTATENAIAASQLTLKTSTNQQLEEQVLTLTEEIKTIDNLRDQHYYWSQALIELGNLFEDDVTLDLLTLERSKGKIYLTGTAGSRESILQFWADVHKSKYFKDINFPLTNLQRAADAPFNFTFYINEEEIKKE